MDTHIIYFKSYIHFEKRSMIGWFQTSGLNQSSCLSSQVSHCLAVEQWSMVQERALLPATSKNSPQFGHSLGFSLHITWK